MERQPDVTQRKPPGFRPLHSFQFSVAEILVLVAMLAVVWSLASRWPVRTSSAGLRTANVFAGTIAVVDVSVGSRPPRAREAAARGILWSLPTVGAWIVGTALVRRWSSRASGDGV
ncbi:MAG: hypothetical protein HYX69_19760 [Planctomycetia bacterium]|nr:hypothetical protein [Planctomycetia bacterium]